MTGGQTIILGETGSNFGAGMTGGMAFIYDPKGDFLARANPETLHISRLSDGHWNAHLKGLLQMHHDETASALAGRLLNHWDREAQHFWHVVPLEILERLDHPVTAASSLNAIA